MNKNAPIPAQLLVGDKELVEAHLQQVLQNEFCLLEEKEMGCFCSSCRKIKHRQHPLLVWITPEKDYTVDDIEIIFEKARFALDDNQKFFFILDKAHTLTSTTANRLLKILEEPPAGYQFVLLTPNTQDLLPTIISRCMVTELAGTSSTHHDHALLSFFIHRERKQDPFLFEQELKKLHLSDTQSFELLQNLIVSFTKKLRTSSDQEQHDFLGKVLDFLMQKMRKPPQSGSSEIFWKHLFLSFPRN